MSSEITPSLESITIRAKYIIPETDFNIVARKILKGARRNDEAWAIYSRIGESLDIFITSERYKNREEFLKTVRDGLPCFFSIMVVEHLSEGFLVEVECRPVMWARITNLGETVFTENKVQEALMECRHFTKQIMTVFKGKEVEPVSVYPIIPRTEIKSRLVNLGLKEVVSPLDKAERHIVQNNFTESLKSSRTAFEKMIDWQMKKRGLEQTNNYKNDLERLKSKGYLDKETTDLLQSYYKCLSNIAVHEKGEVEPGFYEAQMGYGITLIMLDYFANKLP